MIADHPALHEGKLDDFGVRHDRNSEWWQPLADIPRDSLQNDWTTLLAG
jgi:hypothetical protein